MAHNTSGKRQNELVRELLSLVRYRVSGQQELESAWSDTSDKLQQNFSAKRQEISRRLVMQHDNLESEYKRQLLIARESAESQTRVAASERDEQRDAARQAAKVQLSDGEYDWFLSKKRLQKEIEADRVATKEAYRERKANLKAHGNQYTELVNYAKAALARHRCEITVQGGDLLEEPDDSDHLAAHLQTSERISELIRQFQKTFWVRFREERYALIVFLLFTIVAAWPLHSWLGNAIFTGIGSVVVGIIAAAISSLVSGSLAAKSARQFEDSFITTIVAGKEKLLAAQHQSRKRRDKQLEHLTSQLHSTEQQMDADWETAKSDIKSGLTNREQQLQQLAEKRVQTLRDQLAATTATLKQRYEPEMQSLQDQLETSKKQLAKEESDQLAAARAEHEARFQEMTQKWTTGFAAIVHDVNAMRSEADTSRIDYVGERQEPWLPSEPLDVVQLGHTEIDLNSIPNAMSDDRRFHVAEESLHLPVAIDLLHGGSLMIQTSPKGKHNATRLLRLAMLRMLTSVPPGKLRFTIVDPVGLGQDFSAFMHLADHDEQLISHRIWTEGSHINARLTDLTQHMENIIQTYLRNEFPSIQAYNRHAGEVAEAFRVLVVANFPAGFSDEAAARLLSIVNSGPRCGVYTILSIDPEQSLPRNFDLDELRENSNVIIAEEDGVRWAAAPLYDYPIKLDELPSEDGFSQIMHVVGEQAKIDSRVEVPFSAVAPNADELWKSDGRSEISVPLGRAGATKLQSLSLGHGTSQHVLISGKTGSGKSTLLHAMITNLALKYSPAEVQFYLIDFKKGVEFKAYAELKLPHARVIAIESEREFGQSVLQRLDVELRRRGDLFRRVGVQGLAGYRDARPDEHMPRILLIIDEFQEFFVKEDKIAQEASLLLDRLVRQGRAFGIHVMLGSQTLAGAYSLARATIGQMAVRIALQCSAGDAHLILSDDNDAARLLRRPGEAIYNDANGMIEGNHPFQVVWLTDAERENYLHQLSDRWAQTPKSDRSPEGPIVFEGNVAADISRNEQLRKSWAAPAPADVPLAPRAWLGEAIAIKEAPAAVFHRRSGANLMLVGQREEEALGVMASGLLSLAAFSPTNESRSRFIVLDGTRPEANEAGYWGRLKETSGLDIDIVKPRDAVDVIRKLGNEVAGRNDEEDDAGPATFLFIYNLSRFRDLQKSEDDFGFGNFGEESEASVAQVLAGILRDGPVRGIHTILWSDTHTNLMRWVDRQSLRDIESRILFQMSATDSSNLMDSSAAAQLGQHRAIFYSEDQGRAERFRPYGLPEDDFLLDVRSMQSSPERTANPSN